MEDSIYLEANSRSDGQEHSQSFMEPECPLLPEDMSAYLSYCCHDNIWMKARGKDVLGANPLKPSGNYIFRLL
jgi:hypothetical protein